MYHTPLSYLLCQCMVLYQFNKFSNLCFIFLCFFLSLLCFKVWSSNFESSGAPSRDMFINQKILPLDKLDQQEGILVYNVINGTYLLNDFLNHVDVRHQIQLRNIGDLRIQLYATTHSQLFVRYRAINTWNGLSRNLRSS